MLIVALFAASLVITLKLVRKRVDAVFAMAEITMLAIVLSKNKMSSRSCDQASKGTERLVYAQPLKADMYGVVLSFYP